jgi:hypothetical protein
MDICKFMKCANPFYLSYLYKKLIVIYELIR